MDLNYGPGTNTREKLLGVWDIINLASRFNIKALQIFGDSKIIFDWLNRKGKLQVISLWGWKDRIKELQTFFREISFSHIY